MDENSTFDMIYLAIEYLMIGVFLVIVTTALSLRNDFAETRNAQILNTQKIKQYREFNLYNLGECTGTECTNHIYGDQVIELIRRYYDHPDFEIYVDRTSESGDSLVVNRENIALNPELYSLANLQTLFKSKSEFHPYLVYNGIDPSSISSYQDGVYGSITGIALYWQTDN